MSGSRSALAGPSASAASTASAARGRDKSVPAELLKELYRLKIRTKHLISDSLQGQYASVFRGQGLSFREVRGYLPGDDVRWIDWNVSARMNEAFVKVFVEEREMTVMLVVDASGSTEFGTRRAPKSFVAAEVAALAAFSATQSNDQVGLLLATERVEVIVPPRKGDRQVMRIVREILGHEPEHRGTNLAAALETLVQVAKRRTLTFLISDFQFELSRGDFPRKLALAAARHDVIPVMIVDHRDEELPDVGLAAFEDLETGEEILVDTSSARVRAQYRERMRAERAEREKLFKRLGLDLVVVKTEESVVGPMRALFEKRARRRGRR